MELRQYLLLLRRWGWLLVLGGVLGGGGALVGSLIQTPTYQASSKVMIAPPSREQLSDLGYISGQQLIQTYSQLLVTDPVLEEVSRRINDSIIAEQISVQQIRDTQLVEVQVENNDPFLAAETANLLIEVLIENNDTLQSRRFVASEEGLLSQIQVVEIQIATLQTEIDQGEQETLESQKKHLEEQIDLLQREIINLQLEIDSLSSNKVSSSPWLQPPTIQDDDPLFLLKQKQLILEQRQGELDIYQQLYFTLLTVNGAGGNSSGLNYGKNQSQTNLALYQQIYATLLSKYEEVRLARLENTPTVVLVEPAKIPEKPLRPRPLINTVLGGVVGLMIGGGVVFLIEYMDDTIKTPSDVDRIIDHPIVGYIFEMPLSGNNGKGRVYVGENPRSPVAEAFRSLRTNLDFANEENPLKTILVTSSGAGEGKSTVSSNLAIAMAQGGKRVVLLDADLRKPQIHKIFNLSNQLGLRDYLDGQADMKSIVKSTADKVHVITSGKSPLNPAELLSLPALKSLIDNLAKFWDYIIIDSPPMMVTDPIVLSAKTDGVLVVVQPGQTRQYAMRGAIEKLKRANANMLGVVFNRITRQSTYYFQDYSYNYDSANDYMSGEDKDELEPTK